MNGFPPKDVDTHVIQGIARTTRRVHVAITFHPGSKLGIPPVLESCFCLLAGCEQELSIDTQNRCAEVIIWEWHGKRKASQYRCIVVRSMAWQNGKYVCLPAWDVPLLENFNIHVSGVS